MKHISDEIRKIIPEMRRVQQIHFIGIGGAGMSAVSYTHLRAHET